MKKQEDPNHIPKARVTLDLAHRLLELGEQNGVHISIAFRRDIMTFQDRVIAAMNAKLDREVRP